MIRRFSNQLTILASMATLAVFPQWVPELSATEITLARFLGFGIFCIAILFFRLDTLRKVSCAEVKQFFIIGLIANVLCYLSLVLTVRFLGAFQTCILFAALGLMFSVKLQTHWRRTLFGLVTLSTTLVLAREQALFDPSPNVEFGLLTLLIAGGCWRLGSQLHTRLILARPDMDASDHFLLIGLLSLPASLILIPIGISSHGELFLNLLVLQSAKKSFWLTALIPGALCTPIIRARWHKLVYHKKHKTNKASPATTA